MNLKRKFELHLDALLVLSILFLCSVGFNFVLLQQVTELSKSSSQQEMSLLVHEMNLSSQQAYITKLEGECAVVDRADKRVE